MISHNLLQQGTCGFPEEWSVLKGLLGLFRQPEISSPIFHRPLHLQLCAPEEQGYHKGCWITWTHSNAEKARHLQVISLGSLGSQLPSDSSPVSKWNPKPGGSLCNFLVAISSLLSDAWHMAHASWSVTQFDLWLSGFHGTLMQWGNILSFIFSSHSTL